MEAKVILNFKKKKKLILNFCTFLPNFVENKNLVPPLVQLKTLQRRTIFCIGPSTVVFVVEQQHSNVYFFFLQILQQMFLLLLSY